MKKYFKFVALILLASPAVGLADYSDTLKLLGQARSLENSSGQLLSANPSLRQSLSLLYQRILELLQMELASLLPQTTSVSFNTVASVLPKDSLQTIVFDRVPADTSSPINFYVETGGHTVGTLSNSVSGNSVKWQVANYFVEGRGYLISARDAEGKSLGQSNSFTVGPAFVAVVPVNITTPAPSAPVSNDAATADVNNGSIGFWSFDRFSNNCDTKGGATTAADGKVGAALGLNGTDGYCLISNNKSFYPKNFTLALWAKSDVAHNGVWNDSNWFVSLRDQSGFNIGPVKGSKDVKFTIFDDTNLTQVAHLVGTVSPDSIGDWHHYAMTYDGSMARVYLDGVLATSTTVSISRNYAGNKDMFFGLDDVTGQPHGAGTLDEIRLYNRPLTACEIQILAGKGCAGVSSLNFGNSNIAALYAGLK